MAARQSAAPGPGGAAIDRARARSTVSCRAAAARSVGVSGFSKVAVSSIKAVTTGRPDRDQEAIPAGDVDADEEAAETTIRIASAPAASTVADFQRVRRASGRGGSGGGAVGRNDGGVPGHSGGGTGRNGVGDGGRPQGPVGTAAVLDPSSGRGAGSPPVRIDEIGSGHTTAGPSKSVCGLLARRPGYVPAPAGNGTTGTGTAGIGQA